VANAIPTSDDWHDGQVSAIVPGFNDGVRRALTNYNTAILMTDPCSAAHIRLRTNTRTTKLSARAGKSPSREAETLRPVRFDYVVLTRLLACKIAAFRLAAPPALD
jgi:hypothetical protein